MLSKSVYFKTSPTGPVRCQSIYRCVFAEACKLDEFEGKSILCDEFCSEEEPYNAALDLQEW